LTTEVGEARAWIATLETAERERTGVKSLKVTYNAVFGYAIEVTRPNLGRVPPEYQRRQTLAHAERFVTAELLEHERIILRAEERISELEQHFFADALERLAAFQAPMRRTAQALAQLDVWVSLAQVAATRRYTRPTLADDIDLKIEGGRHPVVETALDDGAYMPNDTSLGASGDTSAGHIALLTGPNMAGKSTYLRQVALITLMAQIGSFVPARYAHIGLVDRIFTRVGAEDDLAAGLSTFMLEMVETAYILRHATDRSLIVLDEIGRGTSTHDGLAIARAVIEHIHGELRARTLFATHYHELAELGDSLRGLTRWHMAVIDDDDSPVFLHRLQPGPSERSYGVHVASSAGLPQTVVRRARELLEDRALQIRDGTRPSQLDTPRGQPDGDGDLAALDRDLALALAGLNLAATTPIEALNILFSFQQRALAGLRIGGR
jgi:DNA mismatch repair protein MutS